MNDLTIPPQPPSSGYSEITVELAKMLALVAPTSMSAEQQELWLRAAVDSLEDIRAEELRHVSAEVRRSVTHPAKIVPKIAELVAVRRAERSRQNAIRQLPPLPEPKPRVPGPPLDAAEIRAMPGWLRDMGVRIGFLRREGGQVVDAGR